MWMDFGQETMNDYCYCCWHLNYCCWSMYCYDCSTPVPNRTVRLDRVFLDFHRLNRQFVDYQLLPMLNCCRSHRALQVSWKLRDENEMKFVIFAKSNELTQAWYSEKFVLNHHGPMSTFDESYLLATQHDSNHLTFSGWLCVTLFSIDSYRKRWNGDHRHCCLIHCHLNQIQL